ATHGSLDALIENAASIPQRRYRDALLANVESARGSKELAKIRCDVPITFDPEAVRYRGPSRERCYTLFASLGFRTLVVDFAPTAKTSSRDYAVATSLADVDELAGAIRQAGQLSIAPITPGTSAVRADIVGWSLAAKPGMAR